MSDSDKRDEEGSLFEIYKENWSNEKNWRKCITCNMVNWTRSTKIFPHRLGIPNALTCEYEVSCDNCDMIIEVGFTVNPQMGYDENQKLEE